MSRKRATGPKRSTRAFARCPDFDLAPLRAYRGGLLLLEEDEDKQTKAGRSAAEGGQQATIRGPRRSAARRALPPRRRLRTKAPSSDRSCRAPRAALARPAPAHRTSPLRPPGS